MSHDSPDRAEIEHLRQLLKEMTIANESFRLQIAETSHRLARIKETISLVTHHDWMRGDWMSDSHRWEVSTHLLKEVIQ